MSQLICKHVPWFLGTENKNDCTKVWFWFSTVQKYVHVFIFFKKLGIPFCTAPEPVPYRRVGKKLKTIQGMVLIQYCTVRKYVHVFILFKKLGIPFCTAPVPVYQFICPVNTIMKSFEIYLTKNLQVYKCTYVLHSLRMLCSLFVFFWNFNYRTVINF